MIRLLIVHPTPLVASLLATVLDNNEEFTVVHRTHSADRVPSLLEKTKVDIVLIAASVPDGGALHLTRQLSNDYPDVKVLVIGLPKSKHIILQYVMAGADGYVLKEVPVGELFASLQAIQRNKALVSPDIASALMAQLSQLNRIASPTMLQPEAYAAITSREIEVLELIAEGLTNQEIADRLFIVVGTVKNHIHNILQKLDVQRREEAAVYLPHIVELRAKRI